MIIASVIGKYRSCERAQAKQLIDKLEDFGFDNDLIIFDRGYPSTELINVFETKSIDYLMRVSGGFLKIVLNASGADQVVETKYKGKIIKIRLLKFKLEYGIEETLITNVFDTDFSVQDFKELYFKR
ncbi:transposase [Clostridium gasigenes]|nr:transposase [Clostridium gasigenes]